MGLRRPRGTLSGFVRVIGFLTQGIRLRRKPWAGEFNAFGVDRISPRAGARDIGAGAVHLEVECTATLDGTRRGCEFFDLRPLRVPPGTNESTRDARRHT